MPIYHWEIEQRSENWDRLRLGLPTASNFSKIVHSRLTKGYECRACALEFERKRKKCSECGQPVTDFERLKVSTQAEDLLDELLAEWMFGGPLEDPETQFRSQWMERGTWMETQARQSYEFETGRDVRQCGIIMADNGMVGASPDGVVGDDGLLEMKCPSPKVHCCYMRTGSIEQDYYPQLQGLLWVGQRQWIDVQSFCPPYPTVIIRVQRDETYIRLLADAVNSFAEVLMRARADIVQRYPTVLQRQEAVA